jgi:hypothetical protein
LPIGSRARSGRGTPASFPLPDHLQNQMRQVLVELELLSNGSVAKMDGDSGGGSVRYYSDRIPRLGQHDAPHLYWRDRWNSCTSDAEREDVLELAVSELQAARKSDTAAAGAGETLADLQARLVSRAGLGFERKEVAVAFHTSEAIVAKAWRLAGLDEYTGAPVIDIAGLPIDVRRARVRAYAATVTDNARAIARALGLRYSTVLRDLGRKS